jgi:hypothetical protein
MTTINLQGITRSQAFAALFNYAKPKGLGELTYNRHHRMDAFEAAKILEKGTDIDYLEGRIIKVNFSKSIDSIDVDLYNRDNGKDAAQRAIAYETDRAKGGFMGVLRLPLNLMKIKLEPIYRPGLIEYEYPNFFGGVLRINRAPDMEYLQMALQIRYINRDMDIMTTVNVSELEIEHSRGDDIFLQSVHHIMNVCVRYIFQEDR